MSIYDTLNEKQREAVHYTEGPLLILAGAGSGKTRVLTHRIAYLIDEKEVNPWNILAITFTNKAAGEMRERVDRLVGFGSESIWVATFHSTCVRILRRYIEQLDRQDGYQNDGYNDNQNDDRIHYDNNFTIYDSDDQKTLMKDICKRLQIDTKTYKEKTILAEISSAKNELIGPEEYEKKVFGDFTKRKVAQAYKEYQLTLKRNNALDFDDLIAKTVELFQKCPDVLEYYQDRFRYIMVDEYQDTNTAQFRLVRTLAEKYKNLCVVGDDDQSIYRFRGADIGNILNFERDFADAKVIKLEQNYRSTQTILDAANGVISHNFGRKEKSLWTDNEAGDKIAVRQCNTSYEEADYVVEDIKRRKSRGEIEYKDSAILYRTNAQSRLFEERLLMSGIPYRIVGGINFYARKEIKDLLSYLKTIDNAKDDLAVRRIINIPKRGIGATSLAKVQNYAADHGLSFYEALKQSADVPGLSRAVSKIEDFVTFIQTLKSQAEFYSLSELFKAILDGTKYIDELKAEDTEEAQGRIENIDELLNKIVAYEEETEEPSLSGFLEEVALVADIDTLDDSSDYVVLMTLHSAKGLEFPNVYLTGMEEGVFPGYMSMNSGDPYDIEEERRLCYVGITRAMKHLTITCARQRMLHGETQYNMPSRFLKEVPGSLTDSGRTMTKTPESFRRALVETPQRKTENAFTKKPFDPNQFKVKKADKLEYEVGDTVKHIKFGIGIVKSIVEGGKDFEVTVDFEKVGVKKMFAAFAKLQKM